jgi:AraC-like DNA-binding protein
VETSFPEIPEKFFNQGAILRIDETEQASLRALLSEIVTAIEDPEPKLAGLAVRLVLERRLMDGFLNVLRAGVGAAAPSLTSRTAGAAKHLRQAREFIRETSRIPFQLDELSAHLGMSRRGVELMFRKSLGIGPGTFIRQQRLHGVRRELLVGDPGSSTIKQLAIEWGFLHMGHFSKNYRDLFGETPSQTLMRQATHGPGSNQPGQFLSTAAFQSTGPSIAIELFSSLRGIGHAGHRRVANLQRFFEHKGECIPPSRVASQYHPGDIVVWELGNAEKHIGIVVPGPANRAGEMWVVHNMGAGVKWENSLFDYKVVSHFRFSGSASHKVPQH